MRTFKYRALDQGGGIVSGSIVAATASEVDRRIEYLNLISIAAVAEERPSRTKLKGQFAFFSAPRPEDVTIFTGDLALLLRAGTRIDHGLEFLASDPDIGRMRKTAAAVSNAIISGESFAEALSHHSSVFPPIYVALARVGEASGSPSIGATNHGILALSHNPDGHGWRRTAIFAFGCIAAIGKYIQGNNYQFESFANDVLVVL